MPFPTSLVVKKGSKIFVKCSAGDTKSGIIDFTNTDLPLCFGSDRKHATVRHGVNRISGKRNYHLLQLPRIAGNRRQIHQEFLNIEIDSAAALLMGQQPRRGGDNVAKIRRSVLPLACD